MNSTELKQTPVKAGIHTQTGYSAHADQNTLVNWVRSMPEPPEQIHLVHGESHARHALSKALEQHKEDNSKLKIEKIIGNNNLMVRN